MAERNSYPKIPASNWWAIRTQFQKTLPSAVTPTYLQTLLGITPQSAKNLIPPLRQLGLIDEEGRPTPRANDWRTDAKYDEVCNQMIEEVYPQELRDLYHGPDIDREGCKSWFMHSAMLGEAGANAVTSMYILLNAGLDARATDGPKRAEAPREGKARTTNVSPKPKGKSHTPNPGPPPVNGTQLSHPQASQSEPLPSVHIDLQIHISPQASLEQVEAIFSSIAKHLYRK